MTPAYSELIAAVRREGSGLLAAAALGTDAEVPTCPGWTVEDLLHHVAQVYCNAITLVVTRATSRPEQRPPVPDGEPLAVLTELLDDLVEQLGGVPPDTPVWNWSPNAEHVAAFWARRMAHESAVHRFDAQRAHGVAEPIGGELAADGIDELIDLMVPRVVERDGATLPDGALVLVGGSDGEWRLRLSEKGIERLDVAPAGATVVTGTASALLLALCGRIAWDSLQVEGDPDLLRAFTGAINF
jgi:uncharacterized protein (TIGR03083 family)